MSWSTRRLRTAKIILLSLTAQLLLILAIGILRLMQCLYRHRAIDATAAEYFFQAAKRLEQRSDELARRSGV